MTADEILAARARYPGMIWFKLVPGEGSALLYGLLERTNAMNETPLSAHDHGNCELCDQIERELSAAQAKLAELTAPGEYDHLIERLKRLRSQFGDTIYIEAATAIEQLQARVQELEAHATPEMLQIAHRIGLEIRTLNERAEQAEAKLAECKTELYWKNAALLQCVDEECPNAALSQQKAKEEK